MFTIFKEEKVITTGILVFLGLSILVRLLLAGFYHTMIKETDNMATTNNRLLKQCKVKFANCRETSSDALYHSSAKVILLYVSERISRE